jgi:mRNA-degrading endonuclease RelE of RelBE toxin-antitoxin system
MGSERIVWTNTALKEARKAPFDVAARLIEALARWAESRDAAVDVKKMQGEAHAYRIRVRDWRLVFRVEAGEIVIVKIGPRGSVY